MKNKKIIVACGSGIATSQSVVTRVQEFLREKGIYNVIIEAVDIKSISTEIKDADIYISLVPEAHHAAYPIPIFDGIKFLTGIGAEEEIDKIIFALNQ